MCRSGDLSRIVPNSQENCFCSTNALHRVWSQCMDVGCLTQRGDLLSFQTELPIPHIIYITSSLPRHCVECTYETLTCLYSTTTRLWFFSKLCQIARVLLIAKQYIDGFLFADFWQWAFGSTNLSVHEILARPCTAVFLFPLPDPVHRCIPNLVFYSCVETQLLAVEATVVSGTADGNVCVWWLNYILLVHTWCMLCMS